MTEAADLMDQLIDLAPLGLYPEEADPAAGELVGSYPQAFTHATLLRAILALCDAGATTAGRHPRVSGERPPPAETVSEGVDAGGGP